MTSSSAYAVKLIKPADLQQSPLPNGRANQILHHPAKTDLSSGKFVFRVSQASTSDRLELADPKLFSQQLIIVTKTGMTGRVQCVSGTVKDQKTKLHSAISASENNLHAMLDIITKRRADETPPSVVRPYIAREKPMEEEASLDGSFHLFYAAIGDGEAAYARAGTHFSIKEGEVLLLEGNHRPAKSPVEMLRLVTAPKAIFIGISFYF